MNETLRKVLLLARGPVEMTSRYLRRRAVDGWEFHEWRCTLHCLGRTLIVPHHKGVGHRADDPPSLNDVLECLLDDAASVRRTPFESWADEFGYDRDSRKAMAVFLACRATRRGLQEFFGPVTLERIETA